MYWDRFDICEAYFLALCEWHGGLQSRTYRRLCRLTKPGHFSPRTNLSVETLTENGREIYEGLVARFQMQAATKAWRD